MNGTNLSGAEAEWNATHTPPEYTAHDPPPTVILITSNLQNDFFTRFPKRKESMNRYWVGRKESEKVLGIDQRGPLMQLMTWIRAYGSTIPPETLVPGFQDDLLSGGGTDGFMDGYTDGYQEEGEGEMIDNELDEWEREREKNWEHEDREEERNGAQTTTTVTSDGPHQNSHSTSLLISLAQAAANSPISGSAPTIHQQRSPNVLISPSPAPSSLLSTPSPTSMPNRLTTTETHRAHHSIASNLSDGSPSQQQQQAGSMHINVNGPTLHAMPSAADTPGSIGTPLSAASPASILVPSSSSAPAPSSSVDYRPSIYVIHLRTCIDKNHPSSATSIEKYGEYCLAGSDGIRLCAKMDEDIEKHPNECIINTSRVLSSHTYRTLKKKLQQIRSFVRKQNLARWRSMAQSSPGGVGESTTSPHHLHAVSTSLSSSSSSSSSSRRGTPLKLAVIGGWTDEDVYHLCYELRTRVLATSIATCSQLTASPSQSQHWNTLSQLKRVMNVTVTRTIKELIGWFGIGSLPYRLPGVSYLPRRIWPIMEWSAGPESKPHNFKDDVDGEIMAHLYRNSSRVVIDILVGGFSPSIVLSVNSIDLQGVREAPTVVKLASREDTATEYQAFQRIEEMLGNNAPSIRAFVELGDRGAMKFRYTRMSGGKVRTLRDLFDDLSGPSSTAVVSSASSSASASSDLPSSAEPPSSDPTAIDAGVAVPVVEGEDEGNSRVGSAGPVGVVRNGNSQLIEQMIDEIYGEIFGGWYAASSSSQIDLFSYYFDGFAMSHGDPVSMVHQDSKYLKSFISYVLSKPGTAEAPRFKADSTFYAYPPYEGEIFFYPYSSVALTNLGVLFEKHHGMPYLRTLPPRRLYSTFAHGDANLQNFLLDQRGNIWVIDFFFTEPRNHVLRDMCKTWSCVMYIACEIRTEEQMAQAVLISEELAAARDLHVPLPTVIPGLTDTMLKAIYSILQRLWWHVGRMVKDRSYAVQFQLGLVAEAMRYFLYTTRNMYSKRWALATAVLLSESVLMQEKRIHDVTPSWLPLDSLPHAHCHGSLGMTRAPGNRNYMRFDLKPILPVGTATASTTSTAQGKENEKTSSSQPSNKDSGFRRELTQEERALKEYRERVEVTQKHANMHGVEGSPERLAWQAQLQSEFSTLMHQQDELKQSYYAQLAEAERRSQSRSLQEDEEEEDEPEEDGAAAMATTAASSPHANDDQPNHLPLPSPRGVTAGSTTMTAAAAGKPGHRLRGSALSRSGSGPVSFMAEGSSSKAGGSSLSLPLTLPQSISHPSLQSLLGASDASPVHAAAAAPTKRMPRLQKECLRLREEGVSHLLLLLTDAEFKEMGVDKHKLHSYLSDYGIQMITVSMPPGIMQLPLLMDLVKYSLGILADERKYKLVLVSKGGFHRAGTVAACILCAFGLSPEQAIRTVRECRGAQAIGRDSRERNVTKFDLQWKNLLNSQMVQSADQITQSKEEQVQLHPRQHSEPAASDLQPPHHRVTFVDGADATALR